MSALLAVHMLGCILDVTVERCMGRRDGTFPDSEMESGISFRDELCES